MPSSRCNPSEELTRRRSTASITTSSFWPRRYLAAVLRTALFPEPGSPVISSEPFDRGQNDRQGALTVNPDLIGRLFWSAHSD